MSYDISLYRLRPGADLGVVVQAGAPSDGEPDSRPIIKFSQDEMAALAEVVAGCGGPWDRFQGSDHWEFTHDPEGGSPFQVSIFQDSIGITIPYGRSNAEATTKAVWEILSALRAAQGLRAFDPQCGRELDLDTGRDVFESSFLRSSGVASRAFHGDAPLGSRSSNPPWLLLGLGAGAVVVAATILIALRNRGRASK